MTTPPPAEKSSGHAKPASGKKKGKIGRFIDRVFGGIATGLTGLAMFYVPVSVKLGWNNPYDSILAWTCLGVLVTAALHFLFAHLPGRDSPLLRALDWKRSSPTGRFLICFITAGTAVLCYFGVPLMLSATSVEQGTAALVGSNIFAELILPFLNSFTEAKEDSNTISHSAVNQTSNEQDQSASPSTVTVKPLPDNPESPALDRDGESIAKKPNPSDTHV